ncbi:NB-ARC domain-containing protein, partial [Scytonema sp. PCC 10023]|uniref:NB-ARC domain-containing protein n=1 Tax=Scytonema sp. PCC 10023 TaxID=1680591 RepID=UPI0039C70E84
MPRATYGDDVKARVRRLFEALMSLDDLADDNCDIKFRWDESNSAQPKLIVETTLRHLEALTKKDGKGHLTKAQIREALQRMEDFLGILADNRLQKRGTEKWDFTLTPWFKESAKNLDKFDTEWENRRPEKSKQQAASTTAATLKKPSTEYKKSCFCQAPSLPQYFVERPEHQQAVKNALLDQEADRPGTLVVSAIYGLGGIGKSTLAAALAHDLEVQTHFPDGVLWVTLGQNPDLLPFLGNWIRQLGDRDYKPITVYDAKLQLQTLLYDKKALLVVDDAWNPEHVEPFRVGGSNCRVLVTTREAVIKGATRYDLDVLSLKQSLSLLQKSRGVQLTSDEQQLAEELATTVGFLPLALDLAAAQVAEGVTWAELLEDLQADIARLETLNLPGLEQYSSEEKRKHYSLIASFNLSLRSLTPEMLRQFSWFGILPEDVTITEVMAATLWEMTPRQALTTLRSFKSKALLQLGVTLGEQKQTYKLHDLMHEMAKKLLISEPSAEHPQQLPGLGLKSLADGHSMLLERYRRKTQAGLWHTLPNDGYIHAKLSWHLEQAGKKEELHQLLQEETKEETKAGKNGWYEACDRLGQTAIFVTDVARAWRLAEEISKENSSHSIRLQCRYALMTASLNSLAANLPKELLIALVKKKVWTQEQGLAYALQIPDPEKKVSTLTSLAEYLSQVLKEQALQTALQVAREIADEYNRAKALTALADKLPQALMPEALQVAREIADEYYRANALTTLADKLPQVLPEALQVAREIADEYYRANALTTLADKLPEVLPEALKVAREIANESYRADALRALADKLPQALMPEALKVAREIADES